MKCLRVGPLWGVAILLLGTMACTDQNPTLPEGLTVQAAKPAGIGVVKVQATDPPAAEQETTLDVRVLGSGFDDGSKATWLLAGEPRPNQVKTNSTAFVSASELEANITIALDATVALWDVEVMTLRGKKGIGIEKFEVKEKTPPGQVEFDEYTSVDLGVLSKKHFSYARGVSEKRADGSIVVAGVDARSSLSGNLPPGAFVAQYATIWEVTGTNVTGPVKLPLADDHIYSMAVGVSDDGHYVVGRVYQPFALPNLPVRWVDGAWDRYLPHPFADAIGGGARDVNNSGAAVGWSVDGSQLRVAVSWDASGAPTPLPSTLGGHSQAYGLNNQEYVAGASWGSVWDSEPHHATLWRPDHTACDLDLGGSDSWAGGLTDVIGDGTVLVAGYAGSFATVWEVDGSTCTVLEHWTAEVESEVRVIRLLEDGWQAFGTGQFITSGLVHPMVWTFKDLLGSGVAPLAEEGIPWAVNSDGRVVGVGPVKNSDHAFLWVPQ